MVVVAMVDAMIAAEVVTTADAKITTTIMKDATADIIIKSPTSCNQL